MTGAKRTILIIEDEPQVARLYEGYLPDEYTIRTAHTGAAGLEAAGPEVDAVLLDRRLPDMRGQDVLAKLRDRGLDCPVAMVTAVEPDLDIIEMGFDLYIVKPVSESELHDALERLWTRSEYDATLRRAASLVSKRAVLETQHDADTLADSDEYAELLQQIEELEQELDDMAGSFSPHDYRLLFRDIGQSTPSN